MQIFPLHVNCKAFYSYKCNRQHLGRSGNGDDVSGIESFEKYPHFVIPA
jgi:hypothetical protein